MTVQRNASWADLRSRGGRPAFAASFCLALHLLGLACVGADPPITSIAFAPNGKAVVVGSQAGVSVHRWPDLQRQSAFATRVVNVHDLAFSQDGQTLAVAGGTPAQEGTVELLEWPRGTSKHTLQGHTDSVLAVAWQNESFIATASLDHEVGLWNIQTLQRVRQLKGHSRGVSDVCFLGSKSFLVSCGIDQSLRVWDTDSASIIRTLNNHTREIHQLALRPAQNGLPMVASVSDDRTVRLWQPTIGRMVRFAQLSAAPLAVTWLADGSRVAVACTDGRARIIDPDTVEIVEELTAVGGWAYSIGAHPTDGSLLVGGRNGQLSRVVPTRPAS